MRFQAHDVLSVHLSSLRIRWKINIYEKLWSIYTIMTKNCSLICKWLVPNNFSLFFLLWISLINEMRFRFLRKWTVEMLNRATDEPDQTLRQAFWKERDKKKKEKLIFRVSSFNLLFKFATTISPILLVSQCADTASFFPVSWVYVALQGRPHRPPSFLYSCFLYVHQPYVQFFCFFFLSFSSAQTVSTHRRTDMTRQLRVYVWVTNSYNAGMIPHPVKHYSHSWAMSETLLDL